MVPLTAVVLILPVLLISSLGHLKPRQAAVWLLAALAVLLALSLHDAWRGLNSQPLLSNWEHKPIYSPSVLMVFYSGVFFFIATRWCWPGRRRAGASPAITLTSKPDGSWLYNCCFLRSLWAPCSSCCSWDRSCSCW
jgi:membrane protease YdiL (CAAX protease family)